MSVHRIQWKKKKRRDKDIGYNIFKYYSKLTLFLILNFTTNF